MLVSYLLWVYTIARFFRFFKLIDDVLIYL